MTGAEHLCRRMTPERHLALYRAIGITGESRFREAHAKIVLQSRLSKSRYALHSDISGEYRSPHSKICVTFPTYIYRSTRSWGRGPRVKSEW